MRTDVELIDAYLENRLPAEAREAVVTRKKQDLNFGRLLVLQAKVRFAAILYGRNLRRTTILAASETAFKDERFKERIKMIFG